MSYPVGAVKQDPDSLAVAVRTTHPDDDKAWGVMTIDRGGHYCAEADLARSGTTILGLE